MLETAASLTYPNLTLIPYQAPVDSYAWGQDLSSSGSRISTVMARRDLHLAWRDYSLAKLYNELAGVVNTAYGAGLGTISSPVPTLLCPDSEFVQVPRGSGQSAVDAFTATIRFVGWTQSITSAIETDDLLYARDNTIHEVMCRIAARLGIEREHSAEAELPQFWNRVDDIADIGEPDRSMDMAPATFATRDQVLAKNDDIIASYVSALESCLNHPLEHCSRLSALIYGAHLVHLSLTSSTSSRREYSASIGDDLSDTRVSVNLDAGTATVTTTSESQTYGLDSAQISSMVLITTDTDDARSQSWSDLASRSAILVPTQATTLLSDGAHLVNAGDTAALQVETTNAGSRIEFKAVSKIQLYSGTGETDTLVLPYPVAAGARANIVITYRTGVAAICPVSMSGWVVARATLTTSENETSAGFTCTLADAQALTISRLAGTGSLYITGVTLEYLDLAGPSRATVMVSDGGGQVCRLVVDVDKDGTASAATPALMAGVVTVTLVSSGTLPVVLTRAQTFGSGLHDVEVTTRSMVTPALPAFMVTVAQAWADCQQEVEIESGSWSAYTAWAQAYGDCLRLSEPGDTNAIAAVPATFALVSGVPSVLVSAARPVLSLATPDLIRAGVYVVTEAARSGYHGFPTLYFTQHPASYTGDTGDVVRLTTALNADYSYGYTLVWQRLSASKWITMAVNTNTFTFGLSPALVGQYRVKAVHGRTVLVSNTARVSGYAPVFTTQPASAFFTGYEITLTIASTHTDSWQWYRNGVAIEGKTETTLTISDANTAEASYYCLATNAYQSVASATATVTAQLPLELDYADGATSSGWISAALGSTASFKTTVTGGNSPFTYALNYIAYDEGGTDTGIISTASSSSRTHTFSVLNDREHFLGGQDANYTVTVTDSNSESVTTDEVIISDAVLVLEADSAILHLLKTGTHVYAVDTHNIYDISTSTWETSTLFTASESVTCACLGPDGTIYLITNQSSGSGYGVKVRSISGSGSDTLLYSAGAVLSQAVPYEVAYLNSSTLVLASATKLYTLTMDGVLTEIYTFSSVVHIFRSLTVLGTGNIAHIGANGSSVVVISPSGTLIWSTNAAFGSEQILRNVAFVGSNSNLYMLSAHARTLYSYSPDTGTTAAIELVLGLGLYSNVVQLANTDMFYQCDGSWLETSTTYGETGAVRAPSTSTATLSACAEDGTVISCASNVYRILR